MDFKRILQFADRTLCPKIVFCVQCYSVLYFPTAFYSVNGVKVSKCATHLPALTEMIICTEKQQI